MSKIQILILNWCPHFQQNYNLWYLNWSQSESISISVNMPEREHFCLHARKRTFLFTCQKENISVYTPEREHFCLHARKRTFRNGDILMSPVCQKPVLLHKEVQQNIVHLPRLYSLVLFVHISENKKKREKKNCFVGDYVAPAVTKVKVTSSLHELKNLYTNFEHCSLCGLGLWSWLLGWMQGSLWMLTEGRTKGLKLFSYIMPC